MNKNVSKKSIYSNIQDAAIEIKREVEEAIKIGGYEKFNSLLRGSHYVMPIHEVVKLGFKNYGVKPELINPKLGERNGEVTIYGSRTSKKVDVVITPENIEKRPYVVNVSETRKNKRIDPYGIEYTENCICVDVKCPLVSIGKNSNTLFETFSGQTLDKKSRCPKIVIGNIVVIPLYEYDTEAMKNGEVKFSKKQTNIEKYLEQLNKLQRLSDYSDFLSTDLNDKVCLVVIDFSSDKPHVFKTHKELVESGIVSSNFPSEFSYDNINLSNFISSILNKYQNVHNIENIMKKKYAVKKKG